MNKTKVIARIGENNNTTEVLKELILSGIDAFSLDSNKLSIEFCKDAISKINDLNEKLNMNVAVMLDGIGSKIYVNKFVEGSAHLKTGDKVRIYVDNVLGDDTKLSVNYKGLLQDVKYDSIIKLSNGEIELQVLDKGENFLLCEVMNGGIVYDNTGVVIPGIRLKKEFLNDRDHELIKFASKYNVDYIITSAVSSLDDVLEINDLLIDMENNHLGIITKIENRFALEELDDIVNISDGIMVCREELSIDIPAERIPGIQKMIINKCHLTGKVSIVSTTIESSQKISKAEVSDIANAVLDGTDAVMIIENNNTNNYPINILNEAEKIIKSAEEDIDYMNFLDRAIRSESQNITGNIACSVAEIANRLKCKAIVAPTISGYTARKMSRFRPKSVIIAISTDKDTVKTLSIYFGVYPVLIDNLKSLDDIVKQAKKVVIDNLDVMEGDKIIITGGYPFKTVKHTNLIEIEEL